MLYGFRPEQPQNFLRGAGALLVAIALIVALLVALLVYRLFFLVGIIIGVGGGVAVVLHLWNKFRPVKEEDVNNKHPLGLG
jgi:hypothetical protein